MKFKGNSKKFFKYFLLISWCIIVFLPLITVLIGSFKTYEEFNSTHGMAMPSNFSFENYKAAFIDGKMLQGFFNTFILILFGVTGSVIVGSMVAFILSRFNFKFKKIIMICYLLVSIIPMEVSQVATFKIINNLGLYNTRLSAIILYISADIVMIYIYLQMLDKIPKEIDKAVILEGGSAFYLYRKVIFPLLKPATATVIMLKTISIYNDFYIPFLYMPDKKLNTVATTLFNFSGPAKIEWNIICAAIIISMIPMIILFVFLQKKIVSGITDAAIKG
ncbi:carbohydrate ABC transporter permease [uncultured Clostridium sp.]|jgi:multiple sugar transport system permease protein|uniref:carbohydrate ABC transporter permease n=1 Tax=uncultured Clostridium sp. TaxID=59620 RepID=UPI00262190A8|nr:carbohydrate ABC transporter permease [uncultured Clostridium sp.]